MNDQLSFDGPETPEQRMHRETEEAIRRVNRNADQDWKDAAYSIGVDLAGQRDPFISDAFWEPLEALDVATHEPKALGPVIQRLVRDKIIFWTGAYRQSLRRHGTPMKVWKGFPVPPLTPKSGS